MTKKMFFTREEEDRFLELYSQKGTLPIEGLERFMASSKEQAEIRIKQLMPDLSFWKEEQCFERGMRYDRLMNRIAILMQVFGDLSKEQKEIANDEERNVIFAPLISPKGETIEMNNHYRKWIREFGSQIAVFGSRQEIVEQKGLTLKFYDDGLPFCMDRWEYMADSCLYAYRIKKENKKSYSVLN